MSRWGWRIFCRCRGSRRWSAFAAWGDSSERAAVRRCRRPQPLDGPRRVHPFAGRDPQLPHQCGHRQGPDHPRTVGAGGEGRGLRGLGGIRRLQAGRHDAEADRRF